MEAKGTALESIVKKQMDGAADQAEIPNRPSVPRVPTSSTWIIEMAVERRQIVFWIPQNHPQLRSILKGVPPKVPTFK